MAPGNMGKRFRIIDKDEIDYKKDDFIHCEDDSDLIWSNLFKIIASDNVKEKVVTEYDENALSDFLDQFYIADLCHFAPLGKAGEIHKIKGWPGIRFDAADNFLKKEIKLINPEVVIAQGVGVFHELLTIFKIKSYVTYLDKNKRLVLTADCNGKKIISIPHFGSRMMKNTFWSRHIDCVKDILKDHQIIDY